MFGSEEEQFEFFSIPMHMRVLKPSLHSLMTRISGFETKQLKRIEGGPQTCTAFARRTGKQ